MANYERVLGQQGKRLGAAAGRVLDRLMPAPLRLRISEETPFFQHLGLNETDLAEVILKELIITKGYDPGQLAPRFYNVLRRRFEMGDSVGIPVNNLLHITPNDLYLNGYHGHTNAMRDGNGIGTQTIAAIETTLRHVVSTHLQK